MKEKTIQKYLNQSFWFHATTESSLQNILENGVIASYNQGLPCDFGYGFYLTPTLKQAEHYIRQSPIYRADPNQKYVIIKFTLNLSDFIKSYDLKILPHYDDEFAEFVFNCRLSPLRHTHSYDMVLGVMSDNFSTQLMKDYIANKKSKQETLLGLKKWSSAEQLCLLSQDICDKLHIEDIIYIV